MSPAILASGRLEHFSSRTLHLCWLRYSAVETPHSALCVSSETTRLKAVLRTGQSAFHAPHSALCVSSETTRLKAVLRTGQSAFHAPHSALDTTPTSTLAMRRAS